MGGRARMTGEIIRVLLDARILQNFIFDLVTVHGILQTIDNIITYSGEMETIQHTQAEV